MTNQYDLVAAQYAEVIAPKYTAIAQLVADVARPAPDARVLELAAGTGALTRLLAPLVAERGSYAALDVSPAMLAAAHLDGRVRQVVADLHEVPLPDSWADLVVCSLGPPLSHEAVAEAARLLRPGGRFAATTWGDDYAELVLLNAARRRVGLDDYPRAVAEGVCSHLRDAGLVGVRATTVRLPVVHTSVADYLRYRAAFGCPPGLAAARVPALLDAIADEARPFVDGSGRVCLDWQVVVLEAARGR